MRYKRFQWLITTTALIFSAAALAHGPYEPHVQHAWIRWLPGDLPAGGYFKLINPTQRPMTLVNVSSSDYAHVQLHKTVVKGDQSSMKKIDSVLVPAHGSVEFAPGGYHLMLMHANKPIHVGERVRMFLEFSNHSKIAASFVVKPPDALHY